MRHLRRREGVLKKSLQKDGKEFVNNMFYRLRKQWKGRVKEDNAQFGSRDSVYGHDEWPKSNGARMRRDLFFLVFRVLILSEA